MRYAEQAHWTQEDEVTKPPAANPEDETRAGHRSGEGTESVLRHLMAAARRRQKHLCDGPDSRLPSQLLDDGGPVEPAPPSSPT